MRPPRRNDAKTAICGGTFTVTTFDKREEGFEKKFALDEELKFKAEARRNRLLGLWAAEQLGLSEDAAMTYAREAVAGTFAEGGEKAVIARLASDLSQKGVTEGTIRTQMSELLAQAIAQARAGK
jgi:hypothetical protein